MSELNNKKKFEFVQIQNDIKDEKFETEAIGYFKDAMLRFRKNKAAIVSSIFIIMIVFMAIFGPLMTKYTYREQNIEWNYLPPRIPGLEKIGIFDGTKTMKIRKSNIEIKYKDSLVNIIREYKEKNIDMVDAKVNVYKLQVASDKYFWFGTDALGRSQWSRLWRGCRISLLIAVVSMAVNIFIGVTYGAVSGYYGGVVDMFMQRFIEILEGIPQLVLFILFIMYFGSGIMVFILALVLTGWVGMSTMIRAQFYKYKGQEYVLASRTMGAKDRTLIFRHILPNAIGPIITMASLAIPFAIFTESFLSYLGLGIQAPETSIGVLLAEGQQQLLNCPYLTLFPGLVICILMISFNLFGNGLRDAFDPTLRGIE